MKMKNMMMYLSLFVLPLQAAFFQDCNQVTSALDASVIKLVAAQSVLDRVVALDDVSISKLCQTDSQLEIINSKLALPVSCDNSIVAVIESNLEQTDSSVDVIASAAEELALLIEDALLTSTTCKGIAIDTAMVSPSGFTITTSGRYFLKESISFASTSTEIAGITIDADQVTLNLNGYTLRNTGGIGVKVLDAHTQVTVENGFIGDCGAEGIKLGSSLEYIVLRRLNIFNTTRFGIWFTAAPSVYLTLEDLIFKRLSAPAILLDSDRAVYQNVFLRNIVSLASGTGGRIRCRGVLNLFAQRCVLGSVGGNAFEIDHGTGGASAFGRRFFVEDLTIFSSQRGFTQRAVFDGGFLKNSTFVANNTDGIFLGGFGIRDEHIINNTCAHNGNGITFANTRQSVYVADNVVQDSAGPNIREIDSATSNSIVGNYAYSSAGNNYSGPSMNKNVVALRTSSFLDVPTRWYNVDGRNA